MTARRTGRILGISLAVAGAVLILTWVLEHAMPPPYSGYLALVVVGLTAIQVYKRRPPQRVADLLRLYLKTRARGAEESQARDRLLTRLFRDDEARRRAARDVESTWTGSSEKDRVVAGVGALLARQGVQLDTPVLAAAWDRARDRVTIAGWEAMPPEFVSALRERLDGPEWERLGALTTAHRLFQQRFFRTPSALAADPAAAVADFSRLLASVGNGIVKEHPGDAERAYRLSLRLRPERNLAHAGLAVLLEQTGRSREAAREARTALDILDALAGSAGTERPPTEDISPFRSPLKLREALERVAAGGQP